MDRETPSRNDPRSVTHLLGLFKAGKPEVAEELAELVYDDLRRAAELRLRGRPGDTLEPSALVNECWMRLVRQHCDFSNRAHFLAVAGRLMLRVLLDHDRRASAARRGGGRERVTLSFEVPSVEPDTGVEVTILQEALECLDALDSRKAEVVRLRGLAGLSMAETASELGVSLATAERDWAFARAWLSRKVARLRDDSTGSGEEPEPVFSQD